MTDMRMFATHAGRPLSDAQLVAEIGTFLMAALRQLRTLCRSRSSASQTLQGCKTALLQSLGLWGYCPSRANR